MAKKDFATVDEYIRAQPGDVQKILKRVRNIIREAVPEAEERISYQIPTYKLHGRQLLSFGVWAKHYAIYGATRGVVSKLKDELAPYEISKGTIRFPLEEAVPERLIASIVRLRVEEVGGVGEG